MTRVEMAEAKIDFALKSYDAKLYWAKEKWGVK